jgi:hypothetical protein
MEGARANLHAGSITDVKKMNSLNHIKIYLKLPESWCSFYRIKLMGAKARVCQYIVRVDFESKQKFL